MTHSFAAHDQAFLANPYAAYAELREREPVRKRTHESGWRVFDLMRYADVATFFRAPNLRTVTFHPDMVDMVLQDPTSPFYTLARIVRHALLVQDGEDHRRLRALVNRAFTPRIVEQLTPRIAALVERLLQGPRRAGGLDVIAELAGPLPVIVIAELLGLPSDDHERLKKWSDATATFIDATLREAGLVAAAQAATELAVYLEDVFEARRAHPKDDLISGLVQAREAGDRLSDDELLATVWLVLAAGHETTTNLIGNGLLALLDHPDQYRLLVAEPGLIDSAVEELLRFDSPVQATARVTLAPLSIGGTTIPEGCEVMAFLGAAHRDPAAFERPDALDIRRKDNRHFAFGYGAHFCLGAYLARMEARLAIGAFVRSFPHAKRSDETLVWRPGAILRGLRHLPVTAA